jgi:tRNA (guanine-N7-)-methyltransferase
MARTKLKRLIRVKDFPNVFQFNTSEIGNLVKEYFHFARLFTLEIGCGTGDYSFELAKRFPKRNFIGIDVKGARIFHGARKALDKKLSNVAFIICKAEKLKEILEPNSVEEIYIPFPDPHIRRSNFNRRLISPNFLNIYKYLLTNYGKVHFKTDNQNLFEYAMKVIREAGGKILFATENLYEDNTNLKSEIITSFEEHYIKDGREIKFISFIL